MSQVEKNKVVTMHYTVSAQGAAVESTRDGEPMQYLHGANNIIPGLEQALDGRKVGERFEVDVPADQAYGQRDERLTGRIPLKRLGRQKPKVGDRLQLPMQDGSQRVFFVSKVGRFHADLDGNHPLAGQDISFDVEIVDLRDATESEIDHGHVHHGDDHHDDH